MKINEIVSEAIKQRLDAKCWKGKHKAGTKIKGGIRVNNCVPNESVTEAFSQAAADQNKLKYQKQGRIGHGVGWKPMSDSPHEIVNNIVHQFDNISRMVAYDSASDRVKHSMVDRFMRKYGYPLELFPDVISGIEAKLELNEDWNKVNHHDKTNGLSQKAVNAYRRENPGSKLKTAVTTKPSKLKPGSKAAKRRKSFCARMSGNKGPMKKPNGKPTPKALALRRWNCESIEDMRQMIAEGERMIAEIKKGQKDSNGFTKCWPGKHAEGTKKGKNGRQVRNCVPNESQGVAEAANAAQQAAIAINMKKNHKKPKK